MLEGHHLIVDAHETSFRLDKFLTHRFENLSRTYFQWLISEGYVSVDGKAVKKSAELSADSEVVVQFVPTNELNLEPENIPLEILFEDEHLIAINKPAGLVVHPGPGNWKGTFVNALLYHCKNLERAAGDDIRPGIVHRLDKETSGVLLAAKTNEMHARLSSLFAARTIKKRYFAIVRGVPNERLIDAPIGRHFKDRKRMCVPEVGGKTARTRLSVLRTVGGLASEQLSLLDIDLETGRTHQIRVHLSHIGHPVLGDSVYGNESFNLAHGATRQMLHACELSFVHPLTSEPLLIKAAIPEDMNVRL